MKSAADGIDRTHFFTFSTADTFRSICVLNRITSHIAVFGADSAVNAAVGVHLIAKERDSVKNRINTAKRADIFAEWAVDHDRQQDRDDQDGHFPSVEPSQCTAHSLIQQNQWYTALQCSGRADQFAEIRCTLTKQVNEKQWHQDHEDQ